ncbi:motility associated factor glycosyltransferase family protein [Lysinibacillus xylanilyticus]|uniref:motility associated factor glycosyltransferase family protein n=1 Tax=Lysinibacillus xylanilyticus TaxID=582475 RepID=UPI00083C9D15|nr:6-hydroxymethylpterin diphosphokinase MptE-like protein [Lysinibacillus xylanilyticus]
MQDQFNIELFDSKNGVKTIKVNNYFLHSKYNPLLEAKQFAQKNYKPGCIQIVFGYGKGYIVDEIRKLAISNEKILVIDPIFEGDISCEGFELIAYENNQDILYKQLVNSIKVTDNINLIVSPNYDKIIPNEYKAFLKALNEKLHFDQVTINTFRGFQSVWHRNYINNIKSAIKDYSLKNLYNKYTCPIVIASGGPSLNKQLRLLKEIKNNIILIAAGSTINSLLMAEIEPDYVVSIDGSIENYGHFKELNLNKSKLIYSMTNHPNIRDVFSDDAYFFLNESDSYLKDHLKSIVKKEVVTHSGGGSVANFAFSIALHMTTGPIAFIGQDLAYTDNKTHADNNKYLNVVDEEFKSSRNLIEATGYYGIPVLTDYPFLMMKQAFEKIKSKFALDRQIYNCTEGGVLIEQFTNMPFEKFSEKYATKIVDSVRENDFIEKNVGHREQAIQKLQNEYSLYIRLVKLLKENLAYLSKNKFEDKFSQEILRKLEKNDRAVEKLTKQTSLTVAIQYINIEVLKYFQVKKGETPKEAYKRVYTQSETLYKSLLEAVEGAAKDINELLKNI